MAQIIDGKRIAKEIKDKLKEEVSVLKERGTKICLAVIQVGQDAASSVYVNNKKKACAYIGIDSVSYELKEATTEAELVELIEKLNHTEKVHGISLVLRPDVPVTDGQAGCGEDRRPFSDDIN